MTERAAGLFIWAKTAVEFMEQEREQDSPQIKLELISQWEVRSSASQRFTLTVNIDVLYLQVLDFHFKNSDGTTFKLFKNGFGAIVVAKSPLHHNDLKYFPRRRQDEDARKIGVVLRRLSSMISEGDEEDPSPETSLHAERYCDHPIRATIVWH